MCPDSKLVYHEGCKHVYWFAITSLQCCFNGEGEEGERVWKEGDGNREEGKRGG
jgi:hypothetical protein